MSASDFLHPPPISVTNSAKLNTTFGGVNPLDPDPSHSAVEFYVSCTFPVSNQYGFIIRQLYYCTLIYAVMVRTHKWLVAGALASALTYSGTAAIHAILLMSFYGYKYTDETVEDPHVLGDIDVEALLSIMMAGWVMSIPLLGSSSTLRRLKARIVIIYWTALIGFSIMFAVCKRWRAPYTPYWASAAAICSGTADQNLHTTENVGLKVIESHLWSTHNCTTQCGALNPDLILRSGAQLVPVYQPEFPNSDITYLNIRINARLRSILVSFTPLVILEFIYAVASGGRHPREIRDSLCLYLNGKKQSRFWRALAVLVAFCVYVFATSSLILCPFLFVAVCFLNEVGMLYLPHDELPAAVSQWSPYISTALVISAAIISKYGDTWHEIVWRFVRGRLTVVHQPHKDEIPPVPQESPPKHTIRTIFKPLKHYYSRRILDFQEFHLWILHPIRTSSSNCSRPYPIQAHDNDFPT